MRSLKSHHDHSHHIVTRADHEDVEEWFSRSMDNSTTSERPVSLPWWVGKKKKKSSIDHTKVPGINEATRGLLGFMGCSAQFVFRAMYVHTWYPVQYTSTWQSIIPCQLRRFIPPCDMLWYDTSRQVLMDLAYLAGCGHQYRVSISRRVKKHAGTNVEADTPSRLSILVYWKAQTIPNIKHDDTSIQSSIIARHGLLYDIIDHDRIYMIPGVYTPYNTQYIMILLSYHRPWSYYLLYDTWYIYRT